MKANPKLRDKNDIESLLQEWRSSAYDEADRRTLFITVMKNHVHLRNLCELLSAVDLSEVPAILFDDEADQASLNTRPNDPSLSTTYRSILELRAALQKHAYLQYTATPQAPLLIARIDALSADFAELVSPGGGYVGGQLFFAGESPYVERIPPAEVFRDGQLPDEVPKSLIRALQLFFVGVAAGRYANANGHRSMLIHPSKATATHQRYHQWANLLKDNWHRVLLAVGEQDREELLDEFKAAHDDIACTAGDLPPFEAIVKKLPAAINQTSVALVNSIDGREISWDNGYSHILVGGEKLGRGYTVKGLTVTYMPRSPGGWTADTIQQRARFFGYHSDYLGFCRVYLHPDVQAAFTAYIRHEEDMRNRIRDHQGLPMKEWRRVFYLDRRLAPTRRNVLASPYDRPRLSDGWFAPRSPQLSGGEGSENRQLLGALKDVVFRPNEQYPQHHFAVCHLRDVFERVLVPWSYLDDRDSVGLCYVNCCLESLLEREPDATCLIYRMDSGRQRVRRLSNGAIPQLFQGRSSAGSESYPGDRAFADRSVPTVQIHTLTLEEETTHVADVPAVAIRIPKPEDFLIHDDD